MAQRSNNEILKRILRYLIPFKGLAASVIILNIIFSFFATMSIALVKPVFSLLFSSDKDSSVGQMVDMASGQAPAATSPPADESWIDSFINSLESIQKSFYSFVENLIMDRGDVIGSLINLSIMIVSIFVLKNIFKYLGTVQKVKLTVGIVKSIRDEVFDKMTTLSVGFFVRRKSGSLISIVTNDISVVNSTTINVATDCLRDFIQIILFLILLLSISPYMTFIAFSTSIVSLLLLRVAAKYVKRYGGRMQNAMADYTSVLQETISGIRVVKAYNSEEKVISKFNGQTQRYLKSAVKKHKVISLLPSINEVFAVLALCVVLYVGGLQVLHDKTMSADELMTFLFTLFSIMAPIAKLFGNVTKFQHGFVAAERVFDILDEEPEVKSGKVAPAEFNNKFEIKDVDFAYEEETVVKKANIVIEKGSRIALVGSSGSGKSTMLDLIIRFYDPVAGSISMDGTDIRDFDVKSYRSLFGIVGQDTMLFNDTVANNIKFGAENADDAQVAEASKMANAYKFISKLPKGFQTETGDRGVSLSGGERQRVAIARAIVAEPEIIVFDEATSALDAESEKTVQEAINKTLKDRTAVIVAHRLATIIDCDKIYVFENGRIVEQGTHAELYEMKGAYRNLYDIQFASKK